MTASLARRTSLPRTLTWPRVISALPIVAGLVAEGAWIAVPAALVQALSRHPVVVGPLELAIFVVLGYLAAGRLADRLGPIRWPLVAAGLAGVAAIVGWLSDPGVRDAVALVDWEAAISRNPGGWLAGLAMLRGIAHAGPTAPDGIGSSAVTSALMVIAAALVAGSPLAEPQRTVFYTDGLVAVTVFAAASTVGLALSRMVRMAESTGFEWQPNRAWLALLAVLVATIIAIAIPGAIAMPTPVRLVLQLVPAPLLVVGFFVGLRGVWRSVLLAMAFMGTVVIVLIILSRFGQKYDPVTQNAQQLLLGSDQAHDVPWPAIVAWVVGLAILVGLVALLARYWMREALTSDVGGVSEERSIDTSGRLVPPPPRRARRPATGPPLSAAEAYLALLADIEGRGEVERRVDETAPEHALRLRRSGAGATGLDLLAADFELERFGAMHLSNAENRRGIARWRRLRRRLGRG